MKGSLCILLHASFEQWLTARHTCGAGRGWHGSLHTGPGRNPHSTWSRCHRCRSTGNTWTTPLTVCLPSPSSSAHHLHSPSHPCPCCWASKAPPCGWLSPPAGHGRWRMRHRGSLRSWRSGRRQAPPPFLAAHSERSWRGHVVWW